MAARQAGVFLLPDGLRSEIAQRHASVRRVGPEDGSGNRAVNLGAQERTDPRLGGDVCRAPVIDHPALAPGPSRTHPPAAE